MSFIHEILKYHSLSIVGLEKNTGKTACLNYILNRLPTDRIKVGVTSIGLDGELHDQVTKSSKPEIFLKQGIFFTTTEFHYRQRELVSEVVEVTPGRSALGRMISAKVIYEGKVIISGPSCNEDLVLWSQLMRKWGVDLLMVDGALSRMSSAVPEVCEAMIFSTGAAVSINVNRLVRETAYRVELMQLDEVACEQKELLRTVHEGVWGIDSKGSLVDIGLRSTLLCSSNPYLCDSSLQAYYVCGALTESFLSKIAFKTTITIVVQDFTRIFITQPVYNAFIRRGGSIKVMGKSKLLAVCVNPVAPNGIVLESKELCERLKEVIQLPVYDILRDGDDI